jgi:hypothetical protein
MDDNSEKFVCSFDYASLIELFQRAEQRVCLVVPGVFDEVAEALAKRKANGIPQMQVLTDVSEDNVRNGFGSISAIETLRAAGVDVYECSDNLVSFVICDDIGYWLFPQSRIFRFEKAGTNAVSIDPISQMRLLHQFFPDIPSAPNKVGADDIVDVLKKLSEQVFDDISRPPPDFGSTVCVLNEGKLKDTKICLEKNPPLHPDLKRQINTYSAQVQFVELTFEGANIHAAKVKIPSEALPFFDEGLKNQLETRMRLFENLEADERFKSFLNIKEQIENIRREFLVPITSREKSILRIDKKGEFNKRIEVVVALIKEVNRNLPEFMESLMLDSKDRIQHELVDFLKRNPPENISAIGDERLKERKIQDVSSRILALIRYPEPEKLLNNISIKKHFYDVPVEDFRDEDFLRELEEKGVMAENDISSIVRIHQAFAANMDEHREGLQVCH